MLANRYLMSCAGAGDEVWANLNVCVMITRLDICGSRGLNP